MSVNICVEIHVISKGDRKISSKEQYPQHQPEMTKNEIK